MDSIKELRIRNITKLYYSKPDIQNYLFNFSKNREICPRYFEGFGKRPDAFEYKNDIFELVKKGATSFHCSEELWESPLNLELGMSEKELNELRIGWDFLIDIDCKWFDYAKIAAQAIVETFKQHGISNVGVKFSGSKGFHILLPWKAFPKEISSQKTKDLFPELPRKLISYLRFYSRPIMESLLPKNWYEDFKNSEIKKGIKCKKCQEIAHTYEFAEMYCDFCKRGEYRKLEKNIPQNLKCIECGRKLIKKNPIEISECLKCGFNSKENPRNFSETLENDLYEIMGLDLVLVSPRHLFRMPYSLHEKTALASVVIDQNEIKNFDLKQADPLKVKVIDFVPNVKEGEAKEFVMQALDWTKDNLKENSSKIEGKYSNFKPIKLNFITEENFPPCIKKILLGVNDGRKRSLFALINLFRSIGMEKEILEKKIFEWNEKNSTPLKKGYITSQLSWFYRSKPIMPPNCREFYSGIGICTPDNFCPLIKNPVNYVVKKSFLKTNKKTKENKKHQ